MKNSCISPPPMSLRHLSLEPYGRRHVTIYILKYKLILWRRCFIYLGACLLLQFWHQSIVCYTVSYLVSFFYITIIKQRSLRKWLVLVPTLWLLIFCWQLKNLERKKIRRHFGKFLSCLFLSMSSTLWGAHFYDHPPVRPYALHTHFAILMRCMLFLCTGKSELF